MIFLSNDSYSWSYFLRAADDAFIISLEGLSAFSICNIVFFHGQSILISRDVILSSCKGWMWVTIVHELIEIAVHRTSFLYGVVGRLSD